MPPWMGSKQISANLLETLFKMFIPYILVMFFLRIYLKEIFKLQAKVCAQRCSSDYWNQNKSLETTYCPVLGEELNKRSDSMWRIALKQLKSMFTFMNHITKVSTNNFNCSSSIFKVCLIEVLITWENAYSRVKVWNGGISKIFNA